MIAFITQNIEFILSIISLIIAVISFFFNKERKAIARLIGVLVIVFLFLIVQ